MSGLPRRHLAADPAHDRAGGDHDAHPARRRHAARLVAGALARAGGRRPSAAIVALPLVLPPTVLGFYLLIALGPDGPGGCDRRLLGRRARSPSPSPAW